MSTLKEVFIDEWSFVTNGSPWTAPEIATSSLHGKVFGHPRHEDGKCVRTSRILAVSGRKVTTRNTMYVLGEPSQEYLKWMEENGYEYNPENPIKG